MNIALCHYHFVLKWLSLLAAISKKKETIQKEPYAQELIIQVSLYPDAFFLTSSLHEPEQMKHEACVW